MTQTMTAVVKQPQMTAQQQAIVTFNNKVNGSYVQNQLKSVLGANSGTFATSLVEIFTNDKKLQGCDVNKVVQEAIKAATLKLPLNKQLGYAYLMVFNNWDKETRKSIPTPTLTIGYRGYIQMAMRTGQYRNINADVVYEGELRGKDKLSGSIDLSGEKTSDRIEGFFAIFEDLVYVACGNGSVCAEVFSIVQAQGNEGRPYTYSGQSLRPCERTGTEWTDGKGRLGR